MMLKLGMSRTPSSTTEAPFKSNREERASIPLAQDPLLLPMILFCNENMSNVFCWIIFVLLALSLIIYQLRSILWFHRKIRNKNHNYENKEYALLPIRDGHKQITKILMANEWTRSKFQGCFPIDRIPRPEWIGSPAALIVNLDPH